MRLTAKIEDFSISFWGLSFVVDATAIGQMVDNGIGSYEYWGAKCFDVNYQFEPEEIEITDILITSFGPISIPQLDIDSSFRDRSKIANKRKLTKLRISLMKLAMKFAKEEVSVDYLKKYAYPIYDMIEHSVFSQGDFQPDEDQFHSEEEYYREDWPGDNVNLP